MLSQKKTLAFKYINLKLKSNDFQVNNPIAVVVSGHESELEVSGNESKQSKI